MLPPSLIAAQGTDILSPIMGWGKRTHALSSAVAAARVAVAPRPDPRVAAELSRTLSARATASCWVAVVIIPFTIVAYDGAYYPAQLTRGAIAAAVADALIVLLLIGLRGRVFERYPWLPFALLAGVVCNVTEAVNLLLTGGTESDFVFPYYLISFGIAILFPAPLVAVIVTAFLLPAKLESGEPRIDRGPVDVGLSVQRIAQEAQAYAESLELRLELDVAEDGPFVWSGDERHLDRIVLNLISNACKFSRPGGAVKVAVGSDRDGIWITVADQGIGIAPQDVDRIFDRFVQVESSSTRRFTGTGIGLSIVKQLVTLHEIGRAHV